MITEDCIKRLDTGVIVHHQIFAHVFSQILRFIQYGRHDECVALIGPSGVGKTTMIKYLISYLLKQQENGWRTNLGPPIFIEAPPAEKGIFSWKTIFDLLFTALGDAGQRHKVNLDRYEEHLRTRVRVSSSGATIGQQEDSLCTLVNAFQPIVVIIDESQNLVSAMSMAQTESNVVRIKGWTNKMDTRILLPGTHEARDLLDINEQLGRRVVPIYFPRYQKTADGLSGFAAYYKGVIAGAGLTVDSSLHSDFEEIYNCTLGCPGLLSTMLQRSAAYCLDNKLSCISKEIFFHHRMTYTHLYKAEKTIKEFEAFYEYNEKTFNPDLVLLDLDLGPDINKNHCSIKKAGTLKPGQRKPVRDRVK